MSALSSICAHCDVRMTLQALAGVRPKVGPAGLEPTTAAV